MSYSKTIYKKDTKGKIRYLEISTDSDELVQTSGMLNTTSPVEHRKTCTPKNVGKVNETTGAEQALAQAKSLYTKKIREGYFDSVHEALTIEVIKPMLAKDYAKEKHKLKGKRIALQSKLDGVRCIIKYDSTTKQATAKTRENVEITTIDHILRQVELVLNGQEDVIVDGELYTHGNTFQENTKLVKNDWTEATEPIEYCMYDIVDKSEDLTFEERFEKLVYLFGRPNPMLSIVMTSYLDDTDDREKLITATYAQNIDWGYEGLMIRVAGSKYKVNGRSSDLLKYKEFVDTALEIVDVTPNTANPKHGTVWVKFNGHLQKTGSKISHADREELLTNKDDYIGKTAEIRYFEETDEGKMRFAYYHGVRIDK